MNIKMAKVDRFAERSTGGKIHSSKLIKGTEKEAILQPIHTAHAGRRGSPVACHQSKAIEESVDKPSTP